MKTDLIKEQKKIYHLDRITNIKDSWRLQKIYSFIKKKKCEKVLDIGCGPQSIILELGNNVEKWALDTVKKPDGIKGINYIKGDANQKLPFKEEFFDIVFALELIEHIWDTDEFLKECSRILKKDGILVISTPNMSSFKVLYSWIFSNQLPLMDYGLGHIRYYTPKSLRKQLSDHGFALKKITSCYYRGKNEFITRMIEKLFPNRASCLIVIAKK